MTPEVHQGVEGNGEQAHQEKGLGIAGVFHGNNAQVRLHHAHTKLFFPSIFSGKREG